MRDRAPNSSLSTWGDFILVNSLTVAVILLIVFSGGCGTGVGNPENISAGETIPMASATTSQDFDVPIEQYNQNTSPQEPNGLECGSFTSSNTVDELNTGQDCIKNGLLKCFPARFLNDQTTSQGYRTVSYVAVELTATSCQLRVHTVSNDSFTFVGDEEKTCTKINFGEAIEFACGIGN